MGGPTCEEMALTLEMMVVMLVVMVWLARATPLSKQEAPRGGAPERTNAPVSEERSRVSER